VKLSIEEKGPDMARQDRNVLSMIGKDWQRLTVIGND
jgi:hypothetical protein